MIFYSKSQKTFFDDEIHEQLPPDAQEITAEQHAQLLAALNLGHHIADDLAVHPRPSAAHEWVDGAWVENKELAAEIKAVALAKARAGRLAALNAAAQAYIDAAAETDKLPAFEVQTWPLQAAEAKAWEADPAAPTPVLDGIAAARGEEPDKLKAAALRKALAYSALSAHVAGQRQALQSKIESAKTVAALDKIKIEFTAPEAV
ncbi:phage tail protein [Neisseria animalis]|uniref:Phage tail protein n=1 Tax=Neisseria animalis TaxID=492 RepID=A0A5P3MSV1_NEIAN|nr:phage tail protein [Neisseria animalis]QEY24687.1 phage tail protein [Neisseria animalis]ROW31421.1 phage tail protein [Neisseria animalis]VEE07641.1 putative phage fiber-spike protein [Neisseria animalis]